MKLLNITKLTLAIAAIFLASDLHAAVLSYKAILTVTTSTNLVRANVGDRYELRYDIDAGWIDFDTSTNGAYDRSTLPGGTLSLISGTGTWNPSGLSVDGFVLASFSTNGPDGDNLRLSLKTPYTSSETEFSNIILNLKSNHLSVIHDTGGTQTRAEQFGDFTNDSDWISRDFSLQTTYLDGPSGTPLSGDEVTGTLVFVPVPEPGVAGVLSLIGLPLLLVRRKCRA